MFQLSSVNLEPRGATGVVVKCAESEKMGASLITGKHFSFDWLEHFISLESYQLLHVWEITEISLTSTNLTCHAQLVPYRSVSS